MNISKSFLKPRQGAIQLIFLLQENAPNVLLRVLLLRTMHLLLLGA
jgi:hypothetical protein